MSEQIECIFKSWFIDFDPFDGSIPHNWVTKKFETFLKIKNEKSNDEKIAMYAVTDTGIFPREEKFNKNLSKAGSMFKVVKMNDLVFGMSREILNWGILRDEIAGVSSAYTVYEVDSAINTFYLEYFIKMRPAYFKEIIRLASREGQGIDRGVLMNKELYIPDDKWLCKFVEVYNSFSREIDAVRRENERLIAIRDSLLPKLMSGELDISKMEI